MKPSLSNTITDAALLDDCWMGRTRAAQYLGVSDETLRRWNARGKCLPHHVDRVTGRASAYYSRQEEELEADARHYFRSTRVETSTK